MHLLSTKYKTREGALKRARFENALAKGEFNRGDKVKHYHYTVVQHEDLWRVARGSQERPGADHGSAIGIQRALLSKAAESLAP